MFESKQKYNIQSTNARQQLVIRPCRVYLFQPHLFDWLGAFDIVSPGTENGGGQAPRPSPIPPSLGQIYLRIPD